MPDAIAEDRRARADEHAWLLARLVWPASRLHELDNGEDRELSILLDGPYEGDPRAQAVETRWESGLDGLHGEAYVELPLDDGVAEKVAVLAERGLRAKVRCGGAEVPSPAGLGRFLAACREAGVPFKATAGLHHPLAAEGRHGFLNVLAACAFDDAAALSGDVGLDAAALRWRNRRPGRRSWPASAASSSSPSAAARSSSRSRTCGRSGSCDPGFRHVHAARAARPARLPLRRRRRRSRRGLARRAPAAGAQGVGARHRGSGRGRSRRRRLPARGVRAAAAVHGRRLRRLLLVARARDEPRPHVPAGRRAAAAELAPPARRLPRPRRAPSSSAARRSGARRGRRRRPTPSRRSSGPRDASTSSSSSASSSAFRAGSAIRSPRTRSPSTSSASCS